MTPASGTPPVPGQVGFKVTGQRETSELGANGRYMIGQRITYETTTGGSGSVFVPYSAYNPTNVERLIRDHAMATKQIMNLTG
jgi:hypothetical protein